MLPKRWKKIFSILVFHNSTISSCVEASLSVVQPALIMTGYRFSTCLLLTSVVVRFNVAIKPTDADIKDAMSVSLYPYNWSQFLAFFGCVLSILDFNKPAKGIVKFHDNWFFGLKYVETQQQSKKANIKLFVSKTSDVNISGQKKQA